MIQQKRIKNQLSDPTGKRGMTSPFCLASYFHFFNCLWRRPKYAAQDDKSKDTDRYDGYLALKLQCDGAVWLKTRGCSMLPVFAPMEQVKVVPLSDTVALGQVVVFNQGAKLTAHRIVGRQIVDNSWITKGDTLIHFDKPLPHSALIGAVTAVQGWRGHRLLESDVHTARLSSHLALKLCGYLQQRPTVVYYCLYTLAFWVLFPFRRLPATQRILTVSQKHFMQ